jgi:thioredoxin reductase (NADPH)
MLKFKHYFLLCITAVGLAVASIFNFTKQGQETKSIQQIADKENIVPVAVIGSGPAGLMAAIYSARAGYNVLVIEGPQPGGLLTTTTEVENWPGDVSILGNDIIKGLRAQAIASGVNFMQATVTTIATAAWPFVITTDDNLELNCLSVVMATGSTPRKLHIKGEETFWGNGVTSCALCDAPFFKNKDVVVVGGGDSAAEETLQLLPYVKSVTVLVRGQAMRASQVMQDKLKSPKVKILYNHDPREIIGSTDDGVTAIKVFDKAKNIEYNLNASGLFLAIGHDPNTNLLKDSKVNIDNHGYIVPVGRSQKSSVEGIFAAGDVADPDYRQAGSSAGDGSKAGIDVQRFLQQINWTSDLQELFSSTIYCSKSKCNSLMQVSTLSELNKLVESKPTVVDFYANYCPTCLQMLPVVEAVAAKFQGKINFVKVNVESAPELVDYLKVLKVPCLIAFKDGKPMARYHQILNKAQLTEFVEQNLL